MKLRPLTPIAAAIAFVALAAALDLAWGSVPISFKGLFEALSRSGTDPIAEQIVWNVRLPRVLTALVAGAALAVAGASLQTLVANPLAGPDVLGISAGASLGVALALLGGLGLSLAGWGVTLAAVAGAAVVLLVLLPLAQRLASVTLLLVGLMMATLLTGVISILQVWAEAESGRAFVIWGMGSVSATSWRDLPLLAGAAAVGILLLISSAKSLNALLLGPRTAESLGVPLSSLRLRVILAASLLTGAVTAACGPITFIGVAVPHLAFALSQSADHRRHLPLSALVGAGLLCVCDTLSHLLPGGRTLPLNALTAVVGAPVVAWVILRKIRPFTS